ncbi:MAG: hypothetical protein EOO67_10620, partial [Microbacterium sp.]
MRRVPFVIPAAMLALFLAGCATTGQTPPSGVSPSPTALVACPEQPGVELPPECVPYDPDAAMGLND